MSAIYPKLLPIPENEESLAIPRTKLGVKSLAGSSAGKNRQEKHKEGHKDGHREGYREKKRHKKFASVKDDYIRSLQEAVENLKALNDQQRQQHEAEVQALKANRETCAAQAQTDARTGTSLAQK